MTLEGRRLQPSAPLVVLTGFMGTGKSTVGRILASRIGYRHVDTDVLIESEHGSIPEIFAEHGEARFRELEHETACQLAREDHLVISTGGRLMLDPRNQAVLDPVAQIFCLSASADTVYERTKDSPTERPLLKSENPRARIAELLAERADGYAVFTQVPTDGRMPEHIARSIAEQLET